MRPIRLLLLALTMLWVCQVEAQNVGIGTQVPGYTFTVKDSLGNGKGIAQVSPDGQVALGTFVSNTSAYIQTHTNTDLKFSTDDQPYQMIIQKGTGNVGIGGITPGQKLEVGGNAKINGTVQILGGNPAAGKVLTSDANGLASWQAPVAVASPVGFVITKTEGNEFVANNSTATKIHFNTLPDFQQGAGYSSSNSEFTAPASGFYHFDVGLHFVNSTQGGPYSGLVRIFLYKRASVGALAGAAPYAFQFIRAPVQDESHSFTANLFLTAGEVIDIRIVNSSNDYIGIYGGGPSSYSYFSGYRIF